MAWPIEKIKNTYFEDESLVIDLLYDLGSPTYKRASNALIFMTVCHGGDSMKLYYYLDSGMFHCYTHCCENFDIITLVQKALDCSFPEALKFLAERVGIEEDGRAGLGNKTGFPAIEKKEYKPPRVSEHVRPEITYYDDSLLDYLQCKKVVIDEWRTEGISVKVQEMFEIGYYSLGDQIIVPVRDVNGELAGIRVRERDTYMVKHFGKYHPLIFKHKIYSFPSSEILYGLHITQEYIKAKKKCILFEGEKSVMKMESLYKNPPVAATFGNHIGMGQLKLLQDIGVEEVVVAFDHDGAMEDLSMIQSAEKVLKLSDMKYSFLYDGYEELLESHDSPIDKGKEVFEELLKRRALIRSESFDNVKGQDAVDESIEKFLLENNAEKIKVLRGYSQFKEDSKHDLLVYKVKESE